MGNYSSSFLSETIAVAGSLKSEQVEKIVGELARVRKNKGRVFCLGVGGSAANASHAANDLRKITAIESYAPTDNVSELTARINDAGWETVFEEWLKVSRLSKKDALLIFSVGGGDEKRKISVNLVKAVRYGRKAGCRILGIVGRDGGFTARSADVCVVIPTVNPSHVTHHVESFQSVVWHLMVSHPKLQIYPTKWESIRGGTR